MTAGIYFHQGTTSTATMPRTTPTECLSVSLCFAMTKRQAIPSKLTDHLLAANRHTCCICHEPRHPVERHHINGDPTDSVWDNLAVLCCNCHGLVTAKSNIGCRYTPGEVLRYKKVWEKRCAEAEEDEIDSPVEQIHETKLVGGSSHEVYPFNMEEGDELVFSIDANDYLDAVICDEEDVDEWVDGEDDDEDETDDDTDDDECPLPKSYWSRTGVTEGEYSFVSPEVGRYVLVLVNWDDEATEVTVDAAVWEAEQ